MNKGRVEGEEVVSYKYKIVQAREQTEERLDFDYLLDLFGEHDNVVTPLIHEVRRLRKLLEEKNGCKHVCGLQGYDPMKGDSCPACERGR